MATVPKGGHDDGAHNLGTAHEQMLQAHGCSNLEGRAHGVAPGTERAWPASQAEHVATPQQEIEHQSCRHGLGQRRAHGCPLDAHVEDIDKEIVERDVHHAHQNVQCRRNLHVARALQHRAGQARHLEEDAGQANDQEIHRCVVGNVGRAAQPVGQATMDSQAHHGERQAPDSGAHQRLAQHAARLLEVARPDEMGHLHREAHGHGRRQSAQQPRGGLDEAHRCRGLLAQMAHHGIIDEKHHRGRYLRQNTGHRQLDDEPQLLAARHRAAFTDIRQQVGLCHSSESMCRADKKPFRSSSRFMAQPNLTNCSFSVMLLFLFSAKVSIIL